jgi:F420-dependent oxidoreductase-like protein
VISRFVSKIFERLFQKKGNYAGMTTFPIGLVLFPPPAQRVLSTIKLAEQAGIPMAWVPSWPVGPDGLAIVTAAAAQTSRIGLGTSITITYPRHPLTLANEALVLAEIAPQRIRLGLGASHRPEIEGTYGLDFAKPLGHLREYITVLRGLLWEGAIDFEGDYYRVHARYPQGTPLPRFPIWLAALRKNMLRLAGELSDGAMLIWSPPSYIRSVALPMLEEGARQAGRARPPLMVSAPLLLTKDFGVVRRLAQESFAVYSRFPTYRKLFEEAGYPLPSDGKLPEELIDSVFVYGDEDEIRRRMYAKREAGADEIMATVRPIHDAEKETRALLEVLASL